MNSASRITASALVAAGLLVAGATAASAATPTERISSTAQLQAHVAKAVAAETANAGTAYRPQIFGWVWDVAPLGNS